MIAGDSSSPSELNRAIISIALPTILMNITTPLLGAVDTAVIGHLDKVSYLGGVGIGSLVITFLYWVFGFFRMSTVGLTAQQYGAQSSAGSVRVLAHALLLSMVIGGIIILCQKWIWEFSLQFVSTSNEVRIEAARYFYIRVWAAPAAFAMMVFQGWFYGVRQVKIPVLLTILVNALNIGLDFWFVVGLQWKVAGVAWATLIAQYVGLLLNAFIFWKGYANYWRLLQWRDLKDSQAILKIMKVNSDIFIRTLALQLSNVYFMAKSAALGDEILAVNTILIQMRALAAHALDGIATAAEVLVGNALGTGNRDQLLLCIRYVLWWGMLLGALIGLAFWVSSPWWTRWFTTHASLLPLLSVYLLWVCIEPLVNHLPFSLDGIFIGLTASRSMRNGMLIAVVGVFFPAIWLMGHWWGNHGMWAATLLLYAARAIMLGIPLSKLFADPHYQIR